MTLEEFKAKCAKAPKIYAHCSVGGVQVTPEAAVAWAEMIVDVLHGVSRVSCTRGGYVWIGSQTGEEITP